MGELSFTTLNIMALSKVILLLYIAIIIFLIFKFKKPFAFVIATGLALISFYLTLSWPLQRMWWGNVGDEYFVLAYLSKIMFSNPWHDFYYDWLPNFYPPLYFWVTALVAKFFTVDTTVAAKIGVTGTLIVWFFGSYAWLKLFWQKIYPGSLKKQLVESGWFWYLLPLVYLLLLDFDTVIFKPYEAISALFSIILIGLIARSFYLRRWNLLLYLFIGISGGLLFLIFHFWWIILVPSLFILALFTSQKLLNFKRIILFGAIILAISSIYLLPLLLSYGRYGSENYQATFLMPQDFFTFIPWAQFSVKGILYLAGLVGLVWFRKKSFIKSALVILIVCYIYQFINYLIYLFGGSPIATSKPFYFLGSAALAVGLAQLLIYGYTYLLRFWPKHLQSVVTIVVLLLLVTRLPMAYFMDDPVVLAQIEKDLISPRDSLGLAEIIKNQVPDYAQRTWLSSGTMDINTYLPLSYYIAQNIHFSHHASLYTRRLVEVEQMTEAKTSEDFMKIINAGSPVPVDSLLLYSEDNDEQSDVYSLYFWVDNFPNGGKDLEIYLPKKLISLDDWQLAGQHGNWQIFIKK